MTMLNMGNKTKTYSILLGRPWLKQTKANHNWVDNTLAFTIRERIVAASTIKKIPLKPLERPKYVDDGYDWEDGLSNEKEE